MTPVLTTNLRFTQTLDPTGVARLADAAVTAPTYPVCDTRPRAALAPAACPTTGTANGRSWSSIGLEAMPKVDFHDRWPLHSSS